MKELVIIGILYMSILFVNGTQMEKSLLLVLIDSDQQEQQSIINAVTTSLEAYNNRTETFQVEYNLLETKCKKDYIRDHFYNKSHNIFAIIDVSCPLVTDYTVHISHYLQLPMMVPVSISRSCDSVYQIAPSDDVISQAVVAIMKYFEWQLTTIITEIEIKYFQTLSSLQSKLSSSDINYNTSVSFDDKDDLIRHSQEIFNLIPHIFILNSGHKFSLWFLCQLISGLHGWITMEFRTLENCSLRNLLAYSNGHYYPNYEWILLGLYPGQWWMEYEEYLDQINCSLSSVTTVLNRALVLLPYPDDFEHQNFTSKHIFNTSDYVQDAVTALTLALSTCHNDSNISGSIEDCKDNLNNILLWTNFEGITGHIVFNGMTTRMTNTTLVLQYQYTDSQQSVLVPIGKVNSSSFIPNNRGGSLWPAGKPPDGTPISVIIGYGLGVIIFSSVLSTISLVFIIVCSFFFIICRNKKIMKLTSVKLNVFIIMGSLLLLTGSIPLRTEDFTVSTIKCIIDLGLPSLGYTMCFSVALVKTFRIYYIFKHPSLHKNTLVDWKLSLIVLALITIDFSFFIPISIISWINRVSNLEEQDVASNKNSQGVSYTYYGTRCLGAAGFIYIAITILYKIVLHFVGLLLAYLTRNIEVDILNDSKYSTVIIICSTAILVMLYVIIYLTVDALDRFGIFWALISTGFIFIFVGFTFIPKMFALYKDPKGETIFKTDVCVTATDLGNTGTLTRNMSKPASADTSTVKEISTNNL